MVKFTEEQKEDFIDRLQDIQTLIQKLSLDMETVDTTSSLMSTMETGSMSCTIDNIIGYLDDGE